MIEMCEIYSTTFSVFKICIESIESKVPLQFLESSFGDFIVRQFNWNALKTVCHQIYGAIAVSLSDRKNDFVSFNFDTNHFVIRHSGERFLSRILSSRKYSTHKDCHIHSQKFHSENWKRTFHSTSLFFRLTIVAMKIMNTFLWFGFDLIRAGYIGHDCLLRAIFEAVDTPLGIDNDISNWILFGIWCLVVYVSNKEQ